MYSYIIFWLRYELIRDYGCFTSFYLLKIQILAKYLPKMSKNVPKIKLFLAKIALWFLTNPANTERTAKIDISKYICSENIRLNWFKKLQGNVVTLSGLEAVYRQKLALRVDFGQFWAKWRNLHFLQYSKWHNSTTKPAFFIP